METDRFFHSLCVFLAFPLSSLRSHTFFSSRFCCLSNVESIWVCDPKLLYFFFHLYLCFHNHCFWMANHVWLQLLLNLFEIPSWNEWKTNKCRVGKRQKGCWAQKKMLKFIEIGYGLSINIHQFWSFSLNRILRLYHQV